MRPGIIAQYNDELEQLNYIIVKQDAYPEHVGRILRQHYWKGYDLYRLLLHGDLKILGTTSDLYEEDEELEILTAQHPFYAKCLKDVDGAETYRTTSVDLLTGMLWALARVAPADTEWAFVYYNNEWHNRKL